MQELEGYKLSSEQKRICRLDAAQRAYQYVKVSVTIENAPESSQVADSLKRLSQVHEILRTSLINQAVLTMPLQAVSDTARLQKGVNDTAIQAFAKPDGPTLCWELERNADGSGTLALAAPAWILDAFSMRDLVAQLAETLAGVSREEDEEALQYVDYADWQEEYLASGDNTEASAWWLARTAQGLPNQTLPLERKTLLQRPQKITRQVLSREALAACAKRFETSVETLLHAAVHALLFRFGGALKATAWRRYDGRLFEQVEGAIGPFAKNLPVPSAIQENYNMSDLVAAIAQTDQENKTHAVGYDWESHMGDPGTQAPYVFAFQDWSPLEIGGRRWRLADQECYADDFKAEFSVTGRDDCYVLDLAYQPGRLLESDARNLADCYARLMESLCEAPLDAPIEALDIIPVDRRAAWVGYWGENTKQAQPLPHQRFEAHAKTHPHDPAVVFEEASLSFAAVNVWANRIAHQLRALGAAREQVVGLCLPRSLALAPAWLAILKSGAAYVPLDPELPTQRLELLLKDTQATILLTNSGEAARFTEYKGHVIRLDAASTTSDTQPDTDPEIEVNPNDLAYVLYTSGSTGRPKGVMITHGSLANLADALEEAIYQKAASTQRVGVNASIAFDASVKQLIQIGQGRTLYLIPDAIRLDGKRTTAFMEKHNLDFLDLTPTQARILLQDGLPLNLLPSLNLGGEAVDATLWKQLAEQSTRPHFNLYGPTECTVDTTVAQLEPNRTPHIGKPLRGVGVYVLNSRMQPQPPNVPGELFIAGAGVARGYLNNPEQTERAFVQNPFDDGRTRLYRSGDKVSINAQGELAYLGRVDFQIKVRGVRVEPGEIEATILEHDQVQHTCVVMREDTPGDHRLVAYVVPKRINHPGVEKRSRYLLPNGIAVYQQNKNESDYLYREIFQEQVYARYGIQLPESGVIFDVGANIGMFTLFARLNCPKARIFAFEPLPPLYDTFRLNAELFGGHIQHYRIGLAETEKMETFTFYNRYTMMSGMTNYADADGEVDVIKTFLANQESQGEQGAGQLLENAEAILEGRFDAEHHEVRMRRLSDIIAEEKVSRIDLLKIDVQRAEWDVMRGINAADWPKIQQVVMEVHDARGGGSEGRSGQIEAFLRERGFEVEVNQDALLVGTDRYNLFAWRPEYRPTIAPSETKPNPAALAPILSAEGLRDFLKPRLPEYMLPSRFVILEEMPLNNSGKIDRAALPALDTVNAGGGVAYVAPRGELEKQIAGIWASALKLEQVGMNHNFFDLGGHSLLLVQVYREIRKIVDKEMTMLDLFQHPTVADLAAFIQTDTAKVEQEATQAVVDSAKKRVEAMNRNKKQMKQRLKNL